MDGHFEKGTAQVNDPDGRRRAEAIIANTSHYLSGYISNSRGASTNYTYAPYRPPIVTNPPMMSTSASDSMLIQGHMYPDGSQLAMRDYMAAHGRVDKDAVLDLDVQQAEVDYTSYTDDGDRLKLNSGVHPEYVPYSRPIHERVAGTTEGEPDYAMAYSKESKNIVYGEKKIDKDKRQEEINRALKKGHSQTPVKL